MEAEAGLELRFMDPMVLGIKRSRRCLWKVRCFMVPRPCDFGPGVLWGWDLEKPDGRR